MAYLNFIVTKALYYAHIIHKGKVMCKLKPIKVNEEAY